MVEMNIHNERQKIVFFSKGDDNFIKDIIEKLSVQYETKKVTIKLLADINQIDKWMEWADVCWFEWCDDLLIYACKLEIAKKKKIICRLHSYEAFTYYPSQVNWNYVDRLIFVSEDIRKYVIEHYKVNTNITIVIPNGVDLAKWEFKQRCHGFNVAYVGYINYKKGPMLLLHTIKAIFDQDSRFKFYIAGQFQDPRDYLYFEQMIKEFGLENNYFFEGWQQDLDKWMENKNYILCTSILESQNMSVMQAMAKGIKPVIHNFVGAKAIYNKNFLWNTIDEAISKISDGCYNSYEYREFIENNYSLEKQIDSTNKMINELISK
jgi:glycosyltransferase involved in cell wall biosynthesis